MHVSANQRRAAVSEQRGNGALCRPAQGETRGKGMSQVMPSRLFQILLRSVWKVEAHQAYPPR